MLIKCSRDILLLLSMLKAVVLLNIFVKTDMVKSLKEHLFEIVKKFRSLQNTSVTFVNLMLSCKIKVFVFFKKKH